MDRRIGVIGIGQIGSTICRAIASADIGGVTLAAIADQPSMWNDVELLAEEVRARPCKDVDVLAHERLDLVVEAASVDAARRVVIPMLEAGSDVMLMSVGSLADEDFRRRVYETAVRAGRHVLLPSGAIAGLDAARAAAEGSIEAVVITTTKAPAALAGAPFLVKNNVDPYAFVASTVLFEGSAREAIQGFPANVNVAVALGLATRDAERVRVRIVVDPQATTTEHRVSIRSASVEIETVTRNQPSRYNPRTSQLAIESALSTIRTWAAPIRFA